MRERPILFSAPMVRAILEGRKTQTRRIVKFKGDAPHTIFPLLDRENKPNGEWFFSDPVYERVGRSGNFCPYGKPGDRLWVRETWTGTWHETHGVENMHIAYAADGGERFVVAPDDYVLPKAAAKAGGWVSPLFIKRWASRITLEITDVRVERLQEISEADVIAEGYESSEMTQQDIDDFQISDCAPYLKELARLLGPGVFPARGKFHMLWNQINGAGSWDANPWVWALTFKRLEAAHA